MSKERDALAKKVHDLFEADGPMPVANVAVALEVPVEDVVEVIDSYLVGDKGPKYVGPGEGGGWPG